MLKDGETDFIQGVTIMTSYSRSDRLSSTLNKASKKRKNGKAYSRNRVEWNLVDGKLLKGNTKGKGGFWLNRPNRILAGDS